LLKNNIVLPNVTIKSNPKEGDILLAWVDFGLI
jgi:hypothetical protein